MLVVRNIAELPVIPPGPLTARDVDRIERIPSAEVVIENGRISWFGPEASLNAPVGAAVLDAGGGTVLPGLIDCHTHTVFAGTREEEFVERIRGKSYAEIAERGGGIRVTVEAVRAAGVETLVELALPRLKRMLRHGVTTVEIKSGYGLTVADEFKMLEAVRELDAMQPADLVGTWLATHTTPREFAGRADEYLDMMLDDAVLGRLRDEKLAACCDVFCERTAFSVAQCRRVLLAAKAYGLVPRLHADQLSQLGASRLAAEVGAASADHLEHIDEGGLTAMIAAGCVGVLLPACSFFLGVPQAPARRMLEAGLPLAVATDYNPGSSMVESLPLTLTMACTLSRMTPLEAVVGATANAAAVLRRADRIGAMAVGMAADLLVLDVPRVERWLYEPGRSATRAVIKGGKVVVDCAAE